MLTNAMPAGVTPGCIEYGILPPITEMQSATFKAGDVLVIRCDTNLSMDQANRLRSYVSAQVPGCPVLVLDRGLSAEIVSAPVAA